MVYWMLVEACKPDWNSVEKTAVGLDRLFGDTDFRLVVEKLSLSHWVDACNKDQCWYNKVLYNYGSTRVDELLDPPAYVFRPQLRKSLCRLLRYGVLFRCYDIARSQVPCLSITRWPSRIEKDGWEEICFFTNRSLFALFVISALFVLASGTLPLTAATIRSCTRFSEESRRLTSGMPSIGASFLISSVR